MRVSLIVVNYRTESEVDRLLTQVAGEVDEVIVVDNDSPGDGGRAIAAVVAHHPRVRLVALGRNAGYGAAANEGARHATGDVLVISNPDVEIDPGALRKLAAHVGGDVAVAAPAFRRADGSFLPSAHVREPVLWSTMWSFCRPFGGLATRLRPGWNPTLLPPGEHERERDVLHVLGALMAVDAGAFRAVGGFDERFFLYREETDLCRRLRRQGWRVRHVPSVEAVHTGDASAPSATPIPLRPVAMASHYRYIAKHWGRPAAILLRVVGLAGSAAWALIGPDRDRARQTVAWHARNLWHDPLDPAGVRAGAP